jgi:hypothetical protein
VKQKPKKTTNLFWDFSGVSFVANLALSLGKHAELETIR